MSYVEILTANGLTVTQWEREIQSEYLGQLFWRRFMGTSPDAVIQMKENLMKSPGDTIKYGLRGRVVGGHVTGNAKSRGNEGTLEFYNDSITVDIVKDSVLIENVEMSNQRVAFDVLKEARAGLTEEAHQRAEDDINTAFTNTAIGRVRGRYLYGATDSNWNATHATALAAVDATNDMLTTKLISVAKRKAQLKVNASAKIRPMKVKVGATSWEEWFIFVTHDYSARDLLEQDAAFKNNKLMLPPSTDLNAAGLVSGSTFVGANDGVLIYKYDKIPLALNSNSVQYSHSLLLGAQALGMAWAKRSEFREEKLNYEHDRGFELHEIRGIKKLVYTRANQEDNGQVNVFVSAAND